MSLRPDSCGFQASDDAADPAPSDPVRPGSFDKLFDTFSPRKPALRSEIASTLFRSFRSSHSSTARCWSPRPHSATPSSSSRSDATASRGGSPGLEIPRVSDETAHNSTSQPRPAYRRPHVGHPRVRVFGGRGSAVAGRPAPDRPAAEPRLRELRQAPRSPCGPPVRGGTVNSASATARSRVVDRKLHAGWTPRPDHLEGSSTQTAVDAESLGRLPAAARAHPTPRPCSRRAPAGLHRAR